MVFIDSKKVYGRCGNIEEKSITSWHIEMIRDTKGIEGAIMNIRTVNWATFEFFLRIGSHQVPTQSLDLVDTDI